MGSGLRKTTRLRQQSDYNKSNRVELYFFCTNSVPDFTPLGGSRPDAAVVACAAVKLFTEAPEDVVLPWDALDTTLAFLCAPLIVTQATDLRGRETHFLCPVATVRLRSTGADVLAALEMLTANMDGGLSLTVSLAESVTELQDGFLEGWVAVAQVNLKGTSLRMVGDDFLSCCRNLTAVTLPESLSDVGGWFLAGCGKLTCLDLQHTALRTVGADFAAHCPNLTSILLPDTVTKVGERFSTWGGPVEVKSGSIAVQAAAAKHNELDPSQ